MANAIYPAYKDALLTGSSNVDLTTGTIRVSLIDKNTADYDSTDEFYSDINVSSVVGTSVAIANTTVTDAIFDGDDVTFTSVTGASVEALLIWKDTGVTTTSRLVAWIDSGVTGLPITPSGGNIDVTWNATGIFKL
jgi:uncharacterized protein